MTPDHPPTTAADGRADPTAGSGPAEPPWRVGVLLFDGVEPLDAIGPAQVLWSTASARRWLPPFRPVEVVLVAESSGPVTAGYGLVLHATHGYDTCPPLDALVIPGGTGGEDDDRTARIGRRFQARHEPTLAFVRALADRGAVVASVCTGAFVVAGAGLLAGRRGNTHWSARDELVGFMAARGEPFALVPERVVDDGDIVTAGGVSSGIDLALALVERVLGVAVRELTAEIVEQETPTVAPAT